MIRVARGDCGRVRAALTLWTNHKISWNVLSIHGSARTAKCRAVREVRRYYRHRILLLDPKNDEKSLTMTTTTAKLCRSMEDTLEQILAIDF